MANCDGKGKILPLKIGLSQADKLALEETIYNRVVGQIEDITISGVRDNIQALRNEFPNGTGGIWVTKDDGKWNYYDIVLKDWVAGGLFIEEQEITNLQNTKLDKDMLDWGTMPIEIITKNDFYREVSKVFATTNNGIYMFGTPDELNGFWTIWGKPIGLKATHVYIAIKPLSNKSNRYSFIMWVFASNYGNPYFRVINGYNGSYTGTDDKGWVNVNKLATIDTLKATDLLDMVLVEGDGIIWDISEDNQHIHFHLDNNVDVETDFAVKRFLKNNQQCELAQEEVARCKGLRVWYKFPYQTNILYQCQDIRLPRPLPKDSNWFVSIPIPNPQLFSEKILIQYNAESGMLEFKSSNNGGIGVNIQFHNVKCIK